MTFVVKIEKSSIKLIKTLKKIVIKQNQQIFC